MAPPATEFDVAIIGASLSGAAAAVTLGRGGLSVFLCDKATMPRAKPCGEGLSSAGVACATRLGFFGNSLEAPIIPSRPYRGFRFHLKGRTHTLSLRRSGITVERWLFDSAVARVATGTKGVTTCFGEAVEPRMGNGAITLKTSQGEVTTRYLVVADGSHSTTARHLGVEERHHAPARVGAACHFEGSYRDSADFVHVVIEPDYELYATPLAGGRLNLAVLATTSTPRNIRSLLEEEGLYQRLFQAIGFEGRRVDAIRGRAPLGGLRRDLPPPGVMLVGDAAEEFDPIGGMGMTHALLSGELAAQTILASGRAGHDPWSTAHQRYVIQRNALARPLRRFTQVTYRTLRLSQRWPMLLSLATSPFGEYVTDRILP